MTGLCSSTYSMTCFEGILSDYYRFTTEKQNETEEVASIFGYFSKIFYQPFVWFHLRLLKLINFTFLLMAFQSNTFLKRLILN